MKTAGGLIGCDSRSGEAAQHRSPDLGMIINLAGKEIDVRAL
jgi:hypothetical protein